MARVILDYPELQNQLGDMRAGDVKQLGRGYMGAIGSVGGRQKATLLYNKVYDTEKGKTTRDRIFGSKGTDFFTGNLDFAGNHEMGHIMGSTLIDEETDEAASMAQTYGKPESEILDSVLQNPEIMSADDYANLKRVSPAEAEEDAKKKNDDKTKKRLLSGAIKTSESDLFQKGLTSKYGSENQMEFFAEAVHDVYANGDKARKVSIETVKEYERRQKKLTKKNFFKKKTGIWQKIKNWLFF